MKKNWLAIASAEHVRAGREHGIMQVCHGKAAPLRRIKPGDNVIYYSPTVIFRAKDKFQKFTAIGIVKEGEPYLFDMGGGFCPYRRDVTWYMAEETPIEPLLPALDLSKGRSNWGYQLRFGLLPLSEHDMTLIAKAMNAKFRINN